MEFKNVLVDWIPVRNKRHVVVVGDDVGGDVVVVVAAAAADGGGDCGANKDRANWTKRPPHRRFRVPHRRLSNRMSRPFRPPMSRPHCC